MARSTNSSNAFTRAGWHYTVIQVAALGCGGWLLVHNVHLSFIGFTTVEGWDADSATVACWAMAAAESGIMILATAPDYWDDLYLALIDFGADSPHRVPRLARFILTGMITAFLLAIVGVVYWFDFMSTHQGLYDVAPITAKTAAFTLFFNLGSEVLAFVAGQVGRLAKYAKRRQLEEAIAVEPQIAYGQVMVDTMTAVGKQQAEKDSGRVWADFYQRNTFTRPSNGKGAA